MHGGRWLRLGEADGVKRGGWIRRTRPMRRRASRRVQRKTDADRAFLSWLHLQACRLHWIGGHYGCDGPIQAAHFRDMTGVGRKEPDITCVPLCRRHHEQYDQAKGYFAGMTRDERKGWHRHQQFETQVAFAMTG
jgi:hypothetical protein